MLLFNFIPFQQVKITGQLQWAHLSYFYDTCHSLIWQNDLNCVSNLVLLFRTHRILITNTYISIRLTIQYDKHIFIFQGRLLTYFFSINWTTEASFIHYNDVNMSAMAPQIIGVFIVCSTVCSGAVQRKHQRSASRAFVRGIHRWPENSPQKRASNAKNDSNL